MNKKPGHSQS